MRGTSPSTLARRCTAALRVRPATAASSTLTQGARPRLRPAGTELLVEGDGATDVLTLDDRIAARINGVAATWSPDGGRIAYLRDDALYVSDATGAHEQRLAGIVAPGRGQRRPCLVARRARARDRDQRGRNRHRRGRRLGLAPARRRLTASTRAWSPDGRTIAFERNDGTHWLDLARRTRPGRTRTPSRRAGYDSRFPQWSPTGSALAFISDRQHVPGGATPYQYALYVATPIGADAEQDPRRRPPARRRRAGRRPAAQIAVAAGQECLRWGIYVVSPVGAEARPPAYERLPLHGNAARRRDQRLALLRHHQRARRQRHDPRATAETTRSRATAATTRSTAASGNDFIFAGPGNDRVFGGPGNDTIIGGNGVDRIDCGPGNDTVEAAGPRDIIARNCEHIHRT